ncbi:5'-3' exoribonuclease-like [Cocos nucifera]|nr:5'-3' exoribonuclease-like [Cocos nucifera]
MIPDTGDEAAAAADERAGGAKRRRRRRKGRGRKKVTQEEILASRFVREWAFPDAVPEDEEVASGMKGSGRVVFEFHSHSNCSDGFLSPGEVVERAHRNGVKVLALTDHDTMAGIAEATEAARKFNIRIIPGVEISAVYSPREESEAEEPVHILAYYGGCGPAQFEELEDLLATIRDGRYLRAKKMLLKLSKLKMPLKWEHVAKIAGNGVAPGRLHVARAMVEAGYVENLKQAFSRYLYDGGPAYATGREPFAEAVVQLICRTGGVAALAHPWALKNPDAVIRSLKASGLHAMEVYRSDGKLAGLSDLADTYKLVKLGGSDYHGRSGQVESDLGSVDLPVLAVYEFLKVARPIWCSAIKEILSIFAEEPSALNIEKMVRFGILSNLKGCSTMSSSKDVFDLCLSSWLTSEEREAAEFEAIRVRLSQTIISGREFQMTVVSG